MDRLEQRVAGIETTMDEKLAALATENRSLFTQIMTLGIPGYEVRRPIPVTVRPDGDEFVASFFDAGISTGGDSEQEAIFNLQTLVADFFDGLSVTPDEQLGPALQRQKRVLTESVCRTS